MIPLLSLSPNIQYALSQKQSSRNSKAASSHVGYRSKDRWEIFLAFIIPRWSHMLEYGLSTWKYSPIPECDFRELQARRDACLKEFL
jgi:hypothetical protein